MSERDQQPHLPSSTERLTASSELRRLYDLCHAEAKKGALPTGGGGSEFGCLMAVIDEYRALRADFYQYANHTESCSVRHGDVCTCGCPAKRERIRLSSYV